MTNEAEIREAFSMLRGICDSRGHALLGALENLLLVESAALDGIVRIGKVAEETPARSNVVSMIGRYSEKTPA